MGGNLGNSSIEENLINETGKWKERIEIRLSQLVDCRDDNFLRNIRAYIEDSDYFLAKNDPVRAFECIIWAWAWLEIGEQEGKLIFSEKD